MPAPTRGVLPMGLMKGRRFTISDTEVRIVSPPIGMWLAILVTSVAAVVIGALQIRGAPKDSLAPFLIAIGGSLVLTAAMFIILLARSPRLIVVTADDVQVGNRRFGDQVSSITFDSRSIRVGGRHRYTTIDWVMLLELRTGERVRWSIARGRGAEGKFAELLDAILHVYRGGALAVSLVGRTDW